MKLRGADGYQDELHCTPRRGEPVSRLSERLVFSMKTAEGGRTMRAALNDRSEIPFFDILVMMVVTGN